MKMSSWCGLLWLGWGPLASFAQTPTPDPGIPPLVITTPEPLPISSGSDDDELVDATPESLKVLLSSPFVDFDVRTEVAKGFDEESQGRYSATRKKLRECREAPVAFVWQEFAPFFRYSWNDEFESFAALLLAVWERESRFAMPAQGVHVNPNCVGKPAKVAKPLVGASMSADLAAAARKDATLAAAFGECSLKIADFGPLQWNHRWRLSADEYRGDIERVLLLTTRYQPAELKRLDSAHLASLVKYNPKALFLLGGLSLRDGASNPQSTINAYNTNPEYRSAVNARRLDFLRMLHKGGSVCSVTGTKKGRKRK